MLEEDSRCVFSNVLEEDSSEEEESIDTLDEDLAEALQELFSKVDVDEG